MWLFWICLGDGLVCWYRCGFRCGWVWSLLSVLLGWNSLWWFFRCRYVFFFRYWLVWSCCVWFVRWLFCVWCWYWVFCLLVGGGWIDLDWLLIYGYGGSVCVVFVVVCVWCVWGLVFCLWWCVGKLVVWSVWWCCGCWVVWLVGDGIGLLVFSFLRIVWWISCFVCLVYVWWRLILVLGVCLVYCVCDGFVVFWLVNLNGFWCCVVWELVSCCCCGGIVLGRYVGVWLGCRWWVLVVRVGWFYGRFCLGLVCWIVCSFLVYRLLGGCCCIGWDVLVWFLVIVMVWLVGLVGVFIMGGGLLGYGFWVWWWMVWLLLGWL